MTAWSRGARVDTGRLIMVPGAAGLLFYDMATLVGRPVGAGSAGVLTCTGDGLTCLFYALVVWCYLRRVPAVATTRSLSAQAAAVSASLLPFVLPLLPGHPGRPAQGAADVLLVCGTAWSVWTLHFLGRNLSVIAQARKVVDAGPYRWVRHPLYTGEVVSCLGLAIASGTVAAFAVWALLCALQAYRAIREEQVLLAALSDYQVYRERTAALVPGLFVTTPRHHQAPQPRPHQENHQSSCIAQNGLSGIVTWRGQTASSPPVSCMGRWDPPGEMFISCHEWLMIATRMLWLSRQGHYGGITKQMGEEIGPLYHGPGRHGITHADQSRGPW